MFGDCFVYIVFTLADDGCRNGLVLLWLVFVVLVLE